MTRLARIALLVAVAGGGYLGVRIGELPDPSMPVGTTAYASIREAPRDTATQTRAMATAKRLSSTCHRESLVDARKTHTVLLDVSAAVVCTPRKGPVRQLSTRIFATDRQMERYLGAVRSEAMRGAPGGTCQSTGATTWFDAQGKRAGTVVCLDTGDAGKERIWSIDRERTVFRAKARKGDDGELTRWWNSKTRPVGHDYPTDAEQDLVDMVRRSVDGGLTGCERDGARPPMAGASITCSSAALSALGIVQVSISTLVEAYPRGEYVAAAIRQPGSRAVGELLDQGKRCGADRFAYERWRNDDDSGAYACITYRRTPDDSKVNALVIAERYKHRSAIVINAETTAKAWSYLGRLQSVD